MSGKPWATRPVGAPCVECGRPARAHAQSPDLATRYCSEQCSRRRRRRLYASRWFGFYQGAGR